MSEIPTSLRTGIESIDAEHAQLLSFQQQLIAFCPFQTCEGSDCDESRRAECNAAMTELFSDILIFMVDHFRHEERMMHGMASGHVIGHRVAHEEISRRLSLLADRKVAAPLLATPAELQEVVGHWLRDHIREWDLPLATMIFESGRESALAATT